MCLGGLLVAEGFDGVGHGRAHGEERDRQKKESEADEAGDVEDDVPLAAEVTRGNA